MFNLSRYGIKLAECIRNGDFNCLSGIYDQVNRDNLQILGDNFDI